MYRYTYINTLIHKHTYTYIHTHANRHTDINMHLLGHWPSEINVRQWSRRSGFNPRSSHTKDLKNGT